MPDPDSNMTGESGVPEAVEIVFDVNTGPTAGQVWRNGSNWVVLVHDTGTAESADSWLFLPDRLHQAGFSVLSIDLPGHGVSPVQFGPDAARNAIDAAFAWVGDQSAGRRFLVTAGKSIQFAVPAVAGRGIDGLVVLSPVAGAVSGREFGQFPKLIVFGSENREHLEAARQFFRECRGWTVTSSFAVDDQSHQLLAGHHGNQICDQVISFLREYAAHE